MRSKNKPAPNAAERAHLSRLSKQPCVVCDSPGPVEIHEIKQGHWFTSIPLCFGCHQGDNGWHRTKALWRIKKWDELDALNETLRRVLARSVGTVEAP